MPSHPPALLARAATIRLAAFDVDGVLTDGTLWFDGSQDEPKGFHVQDGYGLKAIQHAGVVIAIISARDSAALRRRAQELGIEEVHGRVEDKAARLLEVCARRSIEASQASFMGDDVPDLAPMSRAGLAAAPVDAHPEVRARVHFLAQRAGGRGAVRDLCDLLLRARGAEGTLPAIEALR